MEAVISAASVEASPADSAAFREVAAPAVVVRGDREAAALVVADLAAGAEGAAVVSAALAADVPGGPTVAADFFASR